MSDVHRRVGSSNALLRAALADAACVIAGIAIYLVTGNVVWLAAGLLMGAGFVLPAVIKQSRSRS